MIKKGYPQNNQKLPSGFTLVELLTVISIISILAGIITVGVLGSRPFARDRKRVSDLNLLSSGLKAYIKEKGTPPNSPGGPSCPAQWDCSLNSTFVNFLAPQYFTDDQIPRDPTHPATQYYYAFRYYTSAGAGCSPPFFVLTALLETNNVNEAQNDSSCWTGTNDNRTYVIVGR
jgi:prepilin-type N-terminal cleavage/methylation domain-containing protein